MDGDRGWTPPTAGAGRGVGVSGRRSPGRLGGCLPPRGAPAGRVDTGPGRRPAGPAVHAPRPSPAVVGGGPAVPLRPRRVGRGRGSGCPRDVSSAHRVRPGPPGPLAHRGGRGARRHGTGPARGTRGRARLRHRPATVARDPADAGGDRPRGRSLGIAAGEQVPHAVGAGRRAAPPPVQLARRGRGRSPPRCRRPARPRSGDGG